MKPRNILIAIIAATLLTACVDHNELTETTRSTQTSPAGFFRGIWHGICAPFALVGIMFGANIGIYESHNTGNWYNFGFLIGIGALGGSSTASSRK